MTEVLSISSVLGGATVQLVQKVLSEESNGDCLCFALHMYRIHKTAALNSSDNNLLWNYIHTVNSEGSHCF